MFSPQGASDTFQHICVIHCVASLSAEYEKNEEAFQEYYDEVEICQSSSAAHFKAAMQVRNREMVDRADLVLCCIERKSGGTYQTVLYAKKQNKQIINLAGGMTTFCE